jgi:hypothetical protein
MKRVLIVLSAITIFTTIGRTQELWSLDKMWVGIGAEVSLPTKNVRDIVKIGFGGFCIFQYCVANNLLVTAQFGYTTWTEKNHTSI